MKKIALISAIALGNLFYNTANAQIRIGLGLHINTPIVRVVAQTPVYADYDSSDDYYYLPDVDAYYSVGEQVYYYNYGGRWISAAYLPGEYRNYDWRNARRYEVRAHQPYLNADLYRDRYRGNVSNWNRADNHADRNYANHDFNRDDHRDNGLQFERRGEMNRGAEHADNRGNDRFDNHDRGNANQPNRNQGQPAQPAQPSQQHGGGQQSQPSRQQGNGGQEQQRGNGGGEQHFTSNTDHSNYGRFGS